GLRGQTATGTVARGQALKLSATLPTAKLDDAGYVIQQVLENIEKVSDPVVRTTLLHSLCSAVERERSSGKDELLRLHELRFQAARKIADPFDRANWLRNGVSYITALDSNLTRRSLTEAFDAMKLIADPERRLSMARYVVMEAWSEPELGLKYLEEYSRMARDDRHNYEVSNLPELYARYGLASDGRALPSQSSAAPDAKSAEEPFARGWAWRQGRTAMDLVRKGDRVGARAIMEKLPAEIHYSPCIDLIYGFSRLGEFDLAQLAANHGTENYRKKDTLDWLASAARLYDRPDLAAEYIRRLEDKSAREINWRNLALYYADHGLRREARSAAINIEGVGSGSTSFFAGMWSLIGEKEKARQAAALNPAFRGDAPTKGSPSDATDFVLLGDMIGLERQETFFAADTVSNRGAFYFACSSGYAYLNRRQEALDMCGKIPAGDNRIYAYEGVGAKIAATSGLDDFAGWVESLPVGEIRAGLRVGWLGEMGHKHLLAQLGLPVRQN
ncbi:MAG: hypothetical protein PSW75_07390, partial [bacterium]|nr:hypothetical protein [bacterium]